MSKELLELVHKINISKWKRKDPLKILYKIMQVIGQKKHHMRRRSWEFMVEALAWKINQEPARFPHDHIFRFEKLQHPDLIEYLDGTKLLDCYIEAARAKPWDYIGEIFSLEGLAGRKNRLGQMLTPKNIVDFMVKILAIGEKQRNPPDNGTLNWLVAEQWNHECRLLEMSRELRLEHQRLMYDVKPVWEKYTIKPETVMDPAVGTGRFLLEASLLAPPNAMLVLFGVEIDLWLYRACLVNMKMFAKHPYSIICADTLMLDQDKSGPGSVLWSMGNWWKPFNPEAFYWQPAPITAKKFSLAHYAKIQK